MKKHGITLINTIQWSYSKLNFSFSYLW